MTRTERAAFPRAILKDRAQSKNNMDKGTPKLGAGHHNWGSLMDERELVNAAENDGEGDFEEAGAPRANDNAKPPPVERRTSSVSEEDREKAREYRKNAFKNGDIDLSAIARTSSAVSSSPPSATSIVSDAETDAVKTI